MSEEFVIFFWYVPDEDFDDDGNFHLKVSSGRLRHKWFPNTASSAMRYLLKSPDAEGLRFAHRHYTLVKIAAKIKDVSPKYPQAIPEGFNNRGYVLEIPIDKKLIQVNDLLNAPEIDQEIDCFTLSKRVATSENELSGLEMGLMSSEEMRKMAVMEVTQYDVLRESSTQGDPKPVFDGLLDPRMGVINRDDRCHTCHLSGHGGGQSDNRQYCQGHFGFIDLPVPIPKLMFLNKSSSPGKAKAKRSDPVINVLNKMCISCKRVKLPDEVLETASFAVMGQYEKGGRSAYSYREVNRIMSKYFSEYKKLYGNKCPHCQAKNPNAIDFIYEYANFLVDEVSEEYNQGLRYLSFELVESMFSEIPDEDCWFYGLNPETSRPENLFFRTLPVIPVTARPLTDRGDGTMDIDDLTKLYQEVVYFADELRSDRAVEYAKKNLKMLFYSVSRLWDNQTRYIGSGGSASRLGYEGSVKKESFKGIKNRLTGKKGRFRHDLQAKQVNNVGRSVVSPDPYLSIDQIGIPISICESVTFPEIVDKDNIKRLKGYFDNAIEGKYPRARGQSDFDDVNYIKIGKRTTPERIKELKDSVEIGTIVVRDLVEEDIVLFSRAPHLHRQSVMALRVKPVPTKSIRFNPTICPPFNADYDGDQMNIHVLQNKEAVEEAKRVMLVSKNTVHARYGKMTVATDQDQTTGLYLLTRVDKRRRNEWNETTGIGSTDEGLPYFSRNKVIEMFTNVFSEIRTGKDKGKLRTIETLPEPDYLGQYYTGRAVFSHLFDVLDANYVSASFTSNSPNTDENGDIIPGKEQVIIQDGVLIQGPIEKEAFGEGGGSIAPSFIYNEGYDKGMDKLTEYIELVTRLGQAMHIHMGYTMGIGDVGVTREFTEREIHPIYEEYAQKIMEVEKYAKEGRIVDYARNNDPDNIIFADSDPINYVEERIMALSRQFDNEVLAPVQNEQGSSNSMQVSVRSKARGKTENVRQMGGSYGMVSLGGRRMTFGVNSNFRDMGPRSLPHFPLNENGRLLPLEHPSHSGFVKSNYKDGMQPHEYWFTSAAGRRSTIESSEGNISKSGYLERKQVRALESLVVNDKQQVVNLRTGRVISPRVGDDGLSPYHIRGTDKKMNKTGYTLTLQPLKFDFRCKHGFHLEESVETGVCTLCSDGSDIDFFRDLFVVKKGIPVSDTTIDEMVGILEKREVTKPNMKKIAKRMTEFFQDSLCRPGEAIGALAAQCLGEPATQASLRTFHFAGKLTATGDIGRIVQIIESPMSQNIQSKEEDHASPRSIIRLKEGLGKETAEKLKGILTQVVGKQIFDIIRYDIEKRAIDIYVDDDKLNLYSIKRSTIFDQIETTLDYGVIKGLFDYDKRQIEFGRENTLMSNKPLRININSENPNGMLFAKNLLFNAGFNGIKEVTKIAVRPPDVDKYNRYHLEVFSVNNAFLSHVLDLHEYFDLDLMETNNHYWVFVNFGLEAALENIYNELDYQMNLTEKSIGEYDMRYIRTITDAMGEHGYLASLGTAGLSVTGNPSILAAASLERIVGPLIAGSVMGNFDPLMGVTESIASGKIPSIGDSSLD